MRIPFSNRTADVRFPSSALDGKPRVTVKEIIDDFREQLSDDCSKIFEAFVPMSQAVVRVTARSAALLEEFMYRDILFRGEPIQITPRTANKWVNLTRLSYGIPDEAIRTALSPFGRVIRIKMDTYQGVYVGTRNILMDIAHPIPSRVMVAGHACNVYYQGQTPTCFRCGHEGHTSQACPFKPGSTTIHPTSEPSTSHGSSPPSGTHDNNPDTSAVFSSSTATTSAVNSTETNLQENHDPTTSAENSLEAPSSELSLSTQKRPHSDDDSGDDHDPPAWRIKGKRGKRFLEKGKQPASAADDFLTNPFEVLADEMSDPEDATDMDPATITQTALPVTMGEEELAGTSVPDNATSSGPPPLPPPCPTHDDPGPTAQLSLPSETTSLSLAPVLSSTGPWT